MDVKLGLSYQEKGHPDVVRHQDDEKMFGSKSEELTGN